MQWKKVKERASSCNLYSRCLDEFRSTILFTATANPRTANDHDDEIPRYAQKPGMASVPAAANNATAAATTNKLI